MKTIRDLKFHTRGGLPFTVPAGSPVEPQPGFPDLYWISPRALPRDSIERHDATYYGLTVRAEEVQP